jgi:hypothetical protein
MVTFVAVLDAQSLHGIRTQDGAVTYLEQRANGVQSEPVTVPSHKASTENRHTSRSGDRSALDRTH